MTGQETTSTDQHEKMEHPEAQGVGIYGDTTTHDLIMTRLWVRNDILESIEIRVLGSDFIKKHAEKFECQLKGKKIYDAEFILGMSPQTSRGGFSDPLDAVYLSITRAFASFHKWEEEKAKEALEQGEPAITEGPVNPT